MIYLFIRMNFVIDFGATHTFADLSDFWMPSNVYASNVKPHQTVFFLTCLSEKQTALVFRFLSFVFSDQLFNWVAFVAVHFRDRQNSLFFGIKFGWVQRHTDQTVYHGVESGEFVLVMVIWLNRNESIGWCRFAINVEFHSPFVCGQQQFQFCKFIKLNL